MRNRANCARLQRNWYLKNRDRVLRELKDKARTNPRWQKERRLKHYYGMTHAQFDEFLVAQNGGCAICLEPLKSGRGTNVDHSHVTGKVRGLLCGKCNLMLGHSKENIMVLQNAINYLRRTTCAT